MSKTSSAADAADKIRDDIEETLKEAAETLGERARPHLQEGRRRLESLNSKAKALINDHPAACVLGALALGYLVARLARRERS
jgi:ElaB/YqjD/DUF883 family membrane-anchored ribosome-binding protein